MMRILLVLLLAGWCRCNPPESTCGNSIIEPGEECDAGGIDTASCNATCTAARCGDGYFNPAADTSCEAP